MMNNYSMNQPTNYNLYLTGDENHAQTMSMLTGEKYGLTNMDGMSNVHIENGTRHIQADTLDTVDLTIRAASALASLTNQIAQEEQQHRLSETPTASNEALQTKKTLIKKQKLKALPFPMKLMYLLCCGKYDDIIAWSHNGLSFTIKKPERVVDFLPRYLSKAGLPKDMQYTSFTRKLQRWGFRSNDSKSYFHKNFQRGKKHLCKQIVCKSNVLPCKQPSMKAVSTAQPKSILKNNSYGVNNGHYNNHPLHGGIDLINASSGNASQVLLQSAAPFSTEAYQYGAYLNHYALEAQQQSVPSAIPQQYVLQPDQLNLLLQNAQAS